MIDTGDHVAVVVGRAQFVVRRKWLYQVPLREGTVKTSGIATSTTMSAKTVKA